ncbi:transposase [Actinomyces viscosus]|uniref:transposase n=1 Tax=Actinomyces viscosus TaxID=1656 RepID=UPI0036F2A349
MTGADGLLPALVKEALERGLGAELTEHLGYDKGESTAQARGNARNGTTPKTVDSEVGPFETCGPLGPGRDLHAAPGA